MTTLFFDALFTPFPPLMWLLRQFPGSGKLEDFGRWTLLEISLALLFKCKIESQKSGKWPDGAHSATYFHFPFPTSHFLNGSIRVELLITGLLLIFSPIPLPAQNAFHHATTNEDKMNDKISYRYRVDGGEWAPTHHRSQNNQAQPPGERFFEVPAQNEDGAWSESATLRLSIHPPWWTTWWAKASALAAALILGFAVYKYRTQQLIRENQIQRQVSELERSALQAQMSPHFIFNCLNSIQNYILQNEKEAAILYLGSFASLVRSILNASVAGNILLSEEVKLLNNYLALEKLRFKDKFTYEVKVAAGLDAFELKIPPLLVQPYVENAVVHGISGKSGGGKVQVFFEIKEGCLEVSILDNGTGLKPNGGSAEKPAGHKPFGMSITRRRLELLSDGRENKVVNTRTLFDENGRPAGTQATIRIGLPEESPGKK